MAGGDYFCDRKCGKSFESLAMKAAHMFICGGKIHELLSGSQARGLLYHCRHCKHKTRDLKRLMNHLAKRHKPALKAS